MSDHPEDQRDIFDEDVFSYSERKDGTVVISWHGKPVMTLKATQAQKFLRRVEGGDRREAQLAMAKITGNFKRGNERQGKG
jgi:hypothetical protein